MKKLLALFLAFLCLALYACGAPAGSSPSGGQPSGTEQSPSGGANAPGSSAPQASSPSQQEGPSSQPVPPSEPFDPLGTWVWEGSPSLTMTLNEDGTVVYNDPEKWLITYNWFRDDNVQTTWVYSEGAQQIVITYVDPDNEWSIDPQVFAVTGEPGYYMIDGGETDYSFIRAENYDDAHARFLDLGNYLQTSYENKEVILNQPYPLVNWRDGDTFTITDVSLEKTVNGDDTDYLLRFYFTLTVTEETRELYQMFEYGAMYAGSGGNVSGTLTPYDLSGNEITSIPAGSTVTGYCEKVLYGGTSDDHLLRWFEGPFLKFGFNGIFAFYIPSDTIDYK